MEQVPPFPQSVVHGLPHGRQVGSEMEGIVAFALGQQAPQAKILILRRSRQSMESPGRGQRLSLQEEPARRFETGILPPENTPGEHDGQREEEKDPFHRLPILSLIRMKAASASPALVNSSASESKRSSSSSGSSSTSRPSFRTPS